MSVRLWFVWEKKAKEKTATSHNKYLHETGVLIEAENTAHYTTIVC